MLPHRSGSLVSFRGSSEEARRQHCWVTCFYSGCSWLYVGHEAYSRRYRAPSACTAPSVTSRLLSNGTRLGYAPKQARLSLRFHRNEGNLFSARGPTSLPVIRTVRGVDTTRKIEAPEKEGRQRSLGQ
ncbi:hypothetical protein MTO96_010344 [Rhipicephalus appendiculatus]